MEKTTKIKFINIIKNEVNYTNVKVNDLTVKNNHSYTISENNIVVHNCTTAYMTGFGSRNCQASTIEDCVRISKVPIIADGGIIYPCDIVKSLVLCASMVMCGNLVSGCSDSPGDIIIKEGIKYKKYFGSASEHQSGKSNRIEGTKKLVLYKDKTVLQQMIYLNECLQSAISYAGGNMLEHLNFVRWH
jgi:GMP reductase